MSGEHHKTWTSVKEPDRPTCPTCRKNDRIQKNGSKYVMGRAGIQRYWKCSRCHCCFTAKEKPSKKILKK